MLVLERNVGEPIRLVVNGIEIFIMIGRKHSTGDLQLLIEAPRDKVTIMRDELLPVNERMVCHPNAYRFRHLINAPIQGNAAIEKNEDKKC